MALFVRSLRAVVNTGVKITQQSWPQPLAFGLHKQIANYSFNSNPTHHLIVKKVNMYLCYTLKHALTYQSKQVLPNANQTKESAILFY